MHKRRRSPSNGVKSNSAEMRLPCGKRSPDGSFHGHRKYGSEHRSFSKRRFRRGPGKHYPPPRQSPPRGDIFMEAGRLAAEYLVSQGLLPRSLLDGKQQNGNLRGRLGDVHGFNVQDRDGPLPSPEGRTSALARLGSMVPDTGPRRRKSLDEFNPGSRSHGRGRRSAGNFRGYGSHWSGENRRNGRLFEKARAFTDMEDAEDELAHGYHGDRRAGSDVGGMGPKITSDESSSKEELAGNLESKLENVELPGDAVFKEISSNNESDLPVDTISGFVNEVARDDNTCSEKIEKEKAPEEFGKQQVSAKDNDLSNKCGNDLQDPCRYPKVSMKSESLFVDQGRSIEDSNMRDSPLVGGSKSSMEEDSVDRFSSLTCSSKSVVSDISKVAAVHSVDEAQSMNTNTVDRSGTCQGLQSSPDGSSGISKQESNQPPGFERCRTMVQLKESSVPHLRTREGAKRSREWPSSTVSQTDELINLQGPRAKQICVHVEKISPSMEMVKTIDEEKLEEGYLSPEDKTDSGQEPNEQKQHFPSFFRICDLNFTDEIAESPEGHFEHHTPTAAPALGVERQTSSAVPSLIYNGNFNSTHTNDECSSDAKEVSQIDATNVCVMGDKIFDASEQKTEPIFSSQDSFLNQTQHAVDLPNLRDGYSLGISDFLGADVSNCSSELSSDVNNLHTGMLHQNQEGILCEDDPIYLSLGEIPLSMPAFMGAWDQPNQDYGKPF